MSDFEHAKKNYDSGLWTNAMIVKLVEKGRLTAEEYKVITGYDYE